MKLNALVGTLNRIRISIKTLENGIKQFAEKIEQMHVKRQYTYFFITREQMDSNTKL